jgi:hypothetical protein
VEYREVEEEEEEVGRLGSGGCGAEARSADGAVALPVFAPAAAAVRFSAADVAAVAACEGRVVGRESRWDGQEDERVDCGSGKLWRRNWMRRKNGKGVRKKKKRKIRLCDNKTQGLYLEGKCILVQ